MKSIYLSETARSMAIPIGFLLELGHNIESSAADDLVAVQGLAFNSEVLGNSIPVAFLLKLLNSGFLHEKFQLIFFSSRPLSSLLFDRKNFVEEEPAQLIGTVAKKFFFKI